MIKFLSLSILGTLWHFLYNFTGQNFFVGLFAPVNESTWEHMKLAFFPGIIIMIIFMPKKYTTKWMASILTATWLIPVIFYTYSGILGFSLMWADILTYFLSIGIAMILLKRIQKSSISAGATVIIRLLALLQFVSFLYFSYNPGTLGIFAA